MTAPRLRSAAAVAAAAFAAVLAVGCGDSPAAEQTPEAAPTADPVEFKDALLRVEINATDGDAGLQIFLDHEPWRSVTLTAPDGTEILRVSNRGELGDYGLTELFSESSEPPFDEFPLDEFKKLFPEGEYQLTGETIDGQRLATSVPLSHDFPDAPAILEPVEDAEAAAEDLTIRWERVVDPPGARIDRYQVLVVQEQEPPRVFSVDLPSDASSVGVPAAFPADPGAYKAEVLAIADNGNQTLNEVEFTVR